MILYRCGNSIPAGVIPPSNWAWHSIALEVFIDQCDEGLKEGGGDKIIVIEIPTPESTLVGPYVPIISRALQSQSSTLFGKDDKLGWWSFNQPYEGPFTIIAILNRNDLNYDQIDYLDTRYKEDRNEWAPYLQRTVSTI